MRKIKVYAVVSIEGFACGSHGEIDTLVDSGIPSNIDFGMENYFKDIDHVVMTREFYSVLFECDLCHRFLEKNCIIVKTEDEAKIPDVYKAEYYNAGNGYSEAIERIRELKATPGGDMWIAGDIELVKAAFDAAIVDEIYITMLPVSLSRGKRLFTSSFNEIQWRTIMVKEYDNGAKQLIYRSKSLDVVYN